MTSSEGLWRAAASSPSNTLPAGRVRMLLSAVNAEVELSVVRLRVSSLAQVCCWGGGGWAAGEAEPTNRYQEPRPSLARLSA